MLSVKQEKWDTHQVRRREGKKKNKIGTLVMVLGVSEKYEGIERGDRKGWVLAMNRKQERGCKEAVDAISGFGIYMNE